MDATLQIAVMGGGAVIVLLMQVFLHFDVVFGSRTKDALLLIFFTAVYPFGRIDLVGAPADIGPALRRASHRRSIPRFCSSSCCRRSAWTCTAC